jgi:four helix bundle protein
VGQGIQSFKDLLVWQKALTLSVLCYQLTKAFPKDEMYGMTAQIRRASVSVPANIAEGHGREHTRSFIQFLRVAQGSLKELETHLMLAEQVNLAPAAALAPAYAMTDEIGRMLRALIRALQEKLGSESDA